MIQILMGENITRADGSEVIWAHLISSDTPASLDSSEMTINGLPDDAVLAAGSTIRYPDGKAMLYEDGGTFVESGSSSDGGGGGVAS